MPTSSIFTNIVINDPEKVEKFIAVRRSWDVWSGIPVHLQVF